MDPAVSRRKNDYGIRVIMHKFIHHHRISAITVAVGRAPGHAHDARACRVEAFEQVGVKVPGREELNVARAVVFGDVEEGHLFCMFA